MHYALNQAQIGFSENAGYFDKDVFSLNIMGPVLWVPIICTPLKRLIHSGMSMTVTVGFLVCYTPFFVIAMIRIYSVDNHTVYYCF